MKPRRKGEEKEKAKREIEGKKKQMKCRMKNVKVKAIGSFSPEVPGSFHARNAGPADLDIP
jgi:hypothetical protein